MGSASSGRWRSHQKRGVVEDCAIFDFAASDGGDITPTILRSHPDLRLVRATLDVASVLVSFQAMDAGQFVGHEQSVATSTTQLHFGGTRRWFVCPRCDRRVRVVLLPRGRRELGCRACFGLSYLSRQRHDKRVKAMMANPEALEGAFAHFASGGLPTGSLSVAIKVLETAQRRSQR